MAQQESPIKLTGKVGDLTFYKSKTGYHARIATGVDSARVRKDPSFQRTRENASEFGRAVRAAKRLRNMLRPLLPTYVDGGMTNRLHSRMSRLLKADSLNNRGERRIQFDNLQMLRHFNFNSTAPLLETVIVPHQLVVDQSRMQLVFPPFFPSQGIVAPKAASHFQLEAVSAWVDFDDPEADFPTPTVDQSEVLDLKGKATSLSLELPLSDRPSDHAVLFVLLGVCFFQYTYRQPYPMPNTSFNALAVVDILVDP